MRNEREWDEFEDGGYDGTNNGYAYADDGQYLAGEDLLSPSVVQDYENFKVQ